MTSPPDPDADAPRATDEARAEWAKEFIYGTIATLIALAGFESVGGAAIAAGAIVAVSAIATWCAHAYSEVLADRITGHEVVTVQRVWRALRGAWPIVIAAVPATLLSMGASVGLWSLSTAIVTANLAGILVMGVAGFVAAKSARAGAMATVGWVMVTAAIGAAIVIVEVAVHR